MSDQSAHKPSAPLTPAVASSKAHAKGKGAPLDRNGQPRSQGLTLIQQLGIWALVVVVGLLFGMGPTMSMLRAQPGSAKIGQVSQTDINWHIKLSRQLQDLINPHRYPMKPDGSDMFIMDERYGVEQQWASEIEQARIAESRGLMPSGAVLHDIVKDFLNETLMNGSGKRYVDVIEELKGSENEITEEELARFLAERTANELLRVRTVAMPALPLSMSAVVSDYLNDKVTVDEMVLKAERFMPKIADNDPEIQVTYDKLREERFRQSARCVATIAYGDVKALETKVVVTPAEIEKYYNDNKKSYEKKPVEPAKSTAKAGDKAGVKPAAPAEAAKDAAPQYKTLAEVTEEIREILKQQAAKAMGEKLVQAFNDTASSGDLLNQKDDKEFKQAAVKAGLAIKDGVLIEAPESAGAQLKIADLGTLNESEVHLFSQEPNFISTPIQTAGTNPTWMLVRLDEKKDPGYKSLKLPEVREKVIAYLRGQRAYKDLLAAAEEARAAAEKLGPGGLAAYAQSPAGKAWMAKIESKPVNANESLYAPPATLDRVQSGEPRMIISLNTLNAPVMLAKDTDAGPDQSPQVKLVQATAFAPGEDKEDRDARYISGLRNELAKYRAHIAAAEQRAKGN